MNELEPCELLMHRGDKLQGRRQTQCGAAKCVSLCLSLMAPGGTLANVTVQRSAGCDSDIANTGRGRDWGRLSRCPREYGWGARREGVRLWFFGVSSD